MKPLPPSPTPKPDGRPSRYFRRLDTLGRWKWPLVASSLLVIIVIVAGWLDINLFRRTRLLTPIPAELMPMVWAMRFAGVILGVAPTALVLRLGGAGQVVWRNGWMALGALPVTIFVMNSFATRVADASLFPGGNETTAQVECPVSDFGGRSPGYHYAKVDCDGSGDIIVEILDSYFDALTAVRQKRAPGADLDVCLQLTIQTSGRNKRLVLPSMFDAPPRLSNCKAGRR